MLLNEKYSPKKINDLLGNDIAKEKIKKWILEWSRGKKGKPILIYGPSGIGKTSFAYVLKKEFDLELLEMNASQFRDKKNVDRIIANAMMAGTLSGKKKIILIDDVDILRKDDRGGALEISRLIKEAEVPILLTADNAWEKKIAPIRMQCELIQLRRITKNSIVKLLREVSEKENTEIEEEVLVKIAENSNGDVRSALNDLQAVHTTNRDREKDIFNLVREVFKGENYLEVRKLMNGDVDLNMVKLWIDENIPYEYSEPGDIARAYYYMARADQFEGRIKFSRWGYLKYVIDFFSAGVALSKTKKNHQFVKYKFPNYLTSMGRTVRKRAMLKGIGSKIGGKTHVNRKTAQEYLPMIADGLVKDRETVVNYYGFSDDEVEFILKIPMEKIKIKKSSKKRKGKTRKGEVGLGSFL